MTAAAEAEARLARSRPSRLQRRALVRRARIGLHQHGVADGPDGPPRVRGQPQEAAALAKAKLAEQARAQARRRAAATKPTSARPSSTSTSRAPASSATKGKSSRSRKSAPGDACRLRRRPGRPRGRAGSAPHAAGDAPHGAQRPCEAARAWAQLAYLIPKGTPMNRTLVSAAVAAALLAAGATPATGMRSARPRRARCGARHEGGRTQGPLLARPDVPGAEIRQAGRSPFMDMDLVPSTPRTARTPAASR